MTGMSEIYTELKIVAYTIGLGAGIGAFYDCIRLLRRIVSHKIFWISIEDLCFFFVAGLLFWNLIFEMADGRLRLYMLLSMNFGLGIYYSIRNALKKHRKITKMKKMSR